MDHDVVVIGSRVAGAATALLLARQGLRVVALDRSRFPSDTLSSHQLQLPGVACLARWGLLDRLLATGVPPTRHVRFDAGPAVVEADYRPFDGQDAMLSPRRTVLDALLVDAAREAGAEVVEGFDVDELVLRDGRVTGVRGTDRGAARTAARTYSARLVVGADGRRSWFADAVGARTYHEAPQRSAAFYVYWQGLELAGGEVYTRDRRAVGAWPTHDGAVVTFVGLPREDFTAARADPEATVLSALDLAGDLGERARAASRLEPVRGTDDLLHRFRAASGPGWTLVGDAGLVMDPVTGQGMGHALQDAEQLAAAVVTGLGGARPLDDALAEYGRRRDRARLPMHEMTADIATYEPQPAADLVFRAVAADPEASQDFLDVLAGVTSPRDFFSLRHVRRLLGWRGTLQLVRSGRPRRRAA